MSLLIYQNVLLKLHRISHLVFFPTVMAQLQLSCHALDNVSNSSLVNVYLARVAVVYTLSGTNIAMMSEESVTTYSLPRWKDSQSREKKTVLRSLQRAFPHLVFQAQPKHRNRPRPSIVYIIDNLDKLSTNTLFITLLQKCLFMKIIPNMFMYRNICI